MTRRGHYRPRPVAFVDLYPEGESAPARPLPSILADLAPDVQRVYLVGPRPGRSDLPAMYAWFGNPAVHAHWSDRGSHLDPDHPVLRLKHRETGRGVDVRRAAEWFGDGRAEVLGDGRDDDGRYAAADAAAAYARLEGLVQQAWPGSALMGTPGRTGGMLWELSLPYDVRYEPLDAETRALIHRTSGQGRIQVCPAVDRAPGFHYLDGRFMYAALCNELPGRLIARDTVDEVPPYQRARYRVRFTVPADWRHLGLFMVPESDSRSGWHYPAEPGSTWETWADGWEVELAQQRGWEVRVLERLLFEKVRPLDVWARKLVDLRQRVAEGAEDRANELVSGALRNILLHGVGYFARREREAIRLIARADLSPDDLAASRGAPAEVTPGVYLVRVPERLPKDTLQFQHPEWAAAVWARARSRLLFNRTQGSGALMLPREDVLGMYVDALYLARDPGWPDSGKPGQFRSKGSVKGPIRAPRTWRELWALRDRATGGGDHGGR